MNQNKGRIGISLSGGGAKGIAHLGVLQALEEVGLKPQVVAGVSAGAIIGAFYADGKNPQEICHFFKESKFFDFVKIVVPQKGFMSTERFYRLIDDFIDAKTFEGGIRGNIGRVQLQLPGCVAFQFLEHR